MTKKGHFVTCFKISGIRKGLGEGKLDKENSDIVRPNPENSSTETNFSPPHQYIDEKLKANPLNLFSIRTGFLQ